MRAMTPSSFASPVADLWRRTDRVLLAIAAILFVLVLLDPRQAQESLLFLGRALGAIAPILALSVALAAGIKAAGAEMLVSRAFAARQGRAILVAAIAGALSPLCSCGVVPLIAGLLAAGVPLAPVMAFWLASPVMDPVMFVLTSGAIGVEFAIAKTAAAIFMGVAGGWITRALTRSALLEQPLRATDAELDTRRLARLDAMRAAPVQWRFWTEADRAQVFLLSATRNAWTLGRWLALAFVLESLMLAWLPAEAVARTLGDSGGMAIPLAVLLGIPAYLNGLAAIPLVGGLIGMGMNPAVGLAFMVAGGVTSIPAAMAVWALVRPRVFVLYVGLALLLALASAWLY
ncbi:MAG TPA: permease, partial [Noviherbaspirillum sp.]|nr:permease [Noviherbaspirillum sp.]